MALALTRTLTLALAAILTLTLSTDPHLTLALTHRCRRPLAALCCSCCDTGPKVPVRVRGGG